MLKKEKFKSELVRKYLVKEEDIFKEIGFMDKFQEGDKTSIVFKIKTTKLPNVNRGAKADSASKKEDAYERYILGQVVLQTSFNDIILNKPVSKYNITGYKQINATRTPELILKVKNKYILVNTKIQELKSI